MKIYKISLIAFYSKNFVCKLWFVRKIESNSISSNYFDKTETLKAFFAVIKHACENINEEKRRRLEYYFLCQISSVRKYVYVLLQLIERLSFKSSNVKIKKILIIEIKNYAHEILFRTINLSILRILSNFVIKSIRITIIINVIDRNFRILIFFI